jgi:hypothetical protein
LGRKVADKDINVWIASMFFEQQEGRESETEATRIFSLSILFENKP